MDKNQIALFSFLKQVNETLENSSLAYRQYLENGKTFKYAFELKKHNSSAIKHLHANKDLLPPDLQNDAQALIAHYEAWTAKWEQLESVLQPSPDDEFVFANEHRFPREAADHLEQEYQRLLNMRTNLPRSK